MKKIFSLAILTLVCAMNTNAAVVVIGNISGPVAITAADAKKLFLGKGKLPNGATAVVYDMAEGNPLREQFHSTVTNKSKTQLKAFWSRLVFTGKGNPPATVNSAAAMISAVASNPNAIGYIDSADVDASVKVILTP